VCIPVLLPVGGVVLFRRTTEQHNTTNGYQNRNVHTMRQLPGPDYTQPQYTNCNHRINQERYILPDDGYMLSETCKRNDDGPLVV
jgi:hypothetical protein